MTWPPIGPDLNAFDGDWARYDAACYESYLHDFYESGPSWPGGVRFAIKRQPELNGKCGTFIHLTSSGEIESERLPALDRYERISWPKMLIDEFAAIHPAAQSSRVKWWKSARNGEGRVLIALADFSYVVVIAERQGYVLLWTAFPVEYSSRRKKLEREFNAYWGI